VLERNFKEGGVVVPGTDIRRVRLFGAAKKYFVPKEGYLALGLCITEPEDILAILFDLDILFVIRPGDGGH
jgi:hypothetical protein